MKIKNYYKVNTLDEAYTLLTDNKNSCIVAGGGWLKFSKKTFENAIDLSQLSLDQIVETEENFEIGSMVTLRQLETNKAFKTFYSGIIVNSVKSIMGVQVRNIATIGGTIMGKYGFSDLLPVLLVLETKLQCYKNGEINLDEFLHKKISGEDILDKIVISKNSGKAKFLTMKKTSNDFPILNMAVSNTNHVFKIAVGARPNGAILAEKAMKYINGQKMISEQTISECANIASEEIVFGTNSKASKEYRKILCNELIKRGLQEVL